jgi:hypothetical protein
MPTFASALSKLARLSLSAFNASDATDATIPLTFRRFFPNCTDKVIDIGQQVGGFSNLGQGISQTRKNIRVAAPSSSHKPGVTEMIALLNSIMNIAPTGAGTAGDPYIWTPAAAGLSTSRSIVYHDTQTYWKIWGCVVARATFAAQSQGELSVDLEWAATNWTNTGSYPSLGTTSLRDPRFLFTDGAITVNGSAATPIKTRSIRIGVDHGVDNNRFFYGAVSAGPINKERMFDFSLDIPYGLHNDMISLCNAEGGVAVEVEFTNPVSGSVLTFTMPVVRSDTVSVEANVPEEQFVPFRAQAYEDFANALPGLSISLVTAA